MSKFIFKGTVVPTNGTMQGMWIEVETDDPMALFAAIEKAANKPSQSPQSQPRVQDMGKPEKSPLAAAVAKEGGVLKGSDPKIWVEIDDTRWGVAKLVPGRSISMMSKGEGYFLVYDGEVRKISKKAVSHFKTACGFASSNKLIEKYF